MPHPPSYSVYKSSGVERLGDVPAHWKVLKLRDILVSVTERNRPDLPLLSVVREKGVILRDVDGKDENHNFIPDDLTNYKVVHKGQFAMNKMKAWQGSYGVSQYEGIVSPAYFTFDIRGVAGDYFHRAIRSKTYVPFFAQASDGVRIGQWDLSQERMKEIPFVLPPLPEQRAIARYLNHVDRRIQRYIEGKEQLIALLQEARQSIIQRTVTRGLDPDVPLKPSGVEWLGDVPAHWEVTATKRHYAIQLGKMLQSVPKRPEDVEVPYLKALHVQWFDVLTSDVPTMWASHYETRLLGIEPGDLLVCEGGEGGRCAVLTDQIDNCIIEKALHRVRPREQSLNVYLQYVMSTVAAIGWFDVINNKATIAHFTREKFDALRIPVPPLAEQRAVAAHLDQATAAIDAAIDNARRQSDRMDEYRASLIAQVVTGKLDVRAAAAQLPADSPAETPVPEQEKIA